MQSKMLQSSQIEGLNQREPDAEVASQNPSLEYKIVDARKMLDKHEINAHYKDQLLKDVAEFGPMEYHATHEIYYGQYLEKLRFGAGLNIHPYNSIYQGEWIDDLPDGTGFKIYTDQKNSYYYGNFEKGLRNGEGSFTFLSEKGDTIWVYNGDFKEDKLTGNGVKELFMQDKLYQGSFMDGKLNGKGRIVWKIRGHNYEGECKDNLMHGRGEFQYANKAKYVGGWVKGKKEGIDCEYVEGNQRFIGEYKNDVRSGQGKLYIDGKLNYEGGWERDLKNGDGKVYDSNGNFKVTTYVNGNMLRSAI